MIESIKSKIASYTRIQRGELEGRVVLLEDIARGISRVNKSICGDESVNNLIKQTLNYVEDCSYLVSSRQADKQYGGRLNEVKRNLEKYMF